MPPAGPSRGRPGKVLLVFEDSGAGAKEVGLGWGLVSFAEGLLVFEDSTPNTSNVTHTSHTSHVTHTSHKAVPSAIGVDKGVDETAEGVVGY